MKKNRAQIHKDISGKLLDSIRLLEILDTLNDGEAKQAIIIDILNQRISYAFHSILKCRRMISTKD